ncbi:nickel-dependent lactate racemase family protein [Pseudothermotoga thermarum]|uniref:Uncharacterized protein n=1 Tax=Pseudothermotoga thermarum DSM 5069 TaxID=688269 RepID=F7YUH3_9THEM|nr:nickel-dependent lactate racemase [Pseudothermotoga thermarum]AEH51444.1 Protein of unknown function DUF2088 [Pseudothermotoga thermarum DSM 5069]
MRNNEIELKYGEKVIKLQIPQNLKCDVLFPNEESSGVVDPFAEVLESLKNPISSPTLKELLQKHRPRKITILVSDITRPSPSHILVPPILEEITKAGFTLDKVKIVFALGFHRKMTTEEMQKAVGKEVYEKVECLNHDISNCVYIGTTKRGTPVEIFKTVFESDFIIATGNLELHWFAGYSGGNKALLPGVCSKRTIEANHSMMLLDGATAGRIEGNPVREDIDEAGKMAGVKFIVNAVLNSKKEIVKVVAGDPVAAHREGTKHIDKMYKVPIKKKYDIVVASCGGYPKDINLYQAQKGLDNAFQAVKPGGIIILVAECREGFGEKTFEEWMRKAKTIDEPLQWIKENFVLGGHKAVGFCRVLKKAEIFLCSKMDPKVVSDIFMQPFDSVDEALKAALKKKGVDADILIMPYANSTLPCE